MVTLDVARWRLALIWFPSCGLLFFLLVLQSLGGAFEGDLQRAWGWALPNFLPTLSLMLSVFAADALHKTESEIRVRKTFLTLSVWLSIFYLVTLLFTVLSQPIVLFYNPDAAFSRIEMLETSNLWLGPLQGLVVVALGVLFFLKEQGGPAGLPGSQRAPSA